MKRRRDIAAIAPLLVALSGCGSNEATNPLETGAVADAGPDAAPPPPAADAGTVKRQVLLRNSFGGPTGNLLADGDFEFSTIPGSGAQVGWRAFDSMGSSTLEIKTETGGLCRSGLRCAIFEPKMIFFLRGTAANQKGMIASLWAKIPAGYTCKALSVVVVTCDTAVANVKLGTSPEPDEKGSCHYSATFAEQTSAQCLYITNTLKSPDSALVDSAVLGPDDGTVTVKSAEIWAPSAQELATLSNIQSYVRRTTPLDSGPRRAPTVKP